MRDHTPPTAGRRCVMKHEGWSWGDLAGELWARGVDPDEVYLDETYLDCPIPEIAAEQIVAHSGKEEAK